MNLVTRLDMLIWPHEDGVTPRDRKGWGRRWFEHIWILCVRLYGHFDYEGNARCAVGTCHNPAPPSRYCADHDDGGLLGEAMAWVDLREEWA